jgi:hypothetical protein
MYSIHREHRVYCPQIRRWSLPRKATDAHAQDSAVNHTAYSENIRAVHSLNTRYWKCFEFSVRAVGGECVALTNGRPSSPPCGQQSPAPRQTRSPHYRDHFVVWPVRRPLRQSVGKFSKRNSIYVTLCLGLGRNEPLSREFKFESCPSNIINTSYDSDA